MLFIIFIEFWKSEHCVQKCEQLRITNLIPHAHSVPSFERYVSDFELR